MKNKASWQWLSSLASCAAVQGGINLAAAAMRSARDAAMCKLHNNTVEKMIPKHANCEAAQRKKQKQQSNWGGGGSIASIINLAAATLHQQLIWQQQLLLLVSYAVAQGEKT